MATAIVIAACSGGASTATPPPTASPTPTPDLAARPDRTPLIKGPESPDGLQVILGTADLGVGLNRFGYLLVAPDGVVSLPTTSVFARFVGEAAGDAPPQAATAEYHAWPYGQRGLYTTDLTFDRPGPWAVDIVVEGPDGSRRTAELFFEVLDAPSALAVGAPAFRSESKTLDDVGERSVNPAGMTLEVAVTVKASEDLAQVMLVQEGQEGQEDSEPLILAAEGRRGERSFYRCQLDDLGLQGDRAQLKLVLRDAAGFERRVPFELPLVAGLPDRGQTGLVDGPQKLPLGKL
ncbi:MAG: hypothetical protein IIC20_09725, partial [Chloroflexi bacterium]|nr:hypothetical protein [Chloroflexota bacterium]